MHERPWAALAAQQHGLLARRQLNALGLDKDHVRWQVNAGRWAVRSPTVVSVTTGDLSPRQLAWLGVLHAGREATLGGRTALSVLGLQRWEGAEVTVMVPDDAEIHPLAGFRFRRTRRALPELRTNHHGLPLLMTEPAALLLGAYERSPRTACGLLAATVQQGLTTAPRLASWIDRLQPLRRARLFRSTLGEIDGGAQSMAEIDVGRVCRRFGLPMPTRQVRRTDRYGRRRFTDCEWQLPDGRRLILEVDGAFHMAAEHWEADIARERGLVAEGAIVVRCTATELRLRPERVVADLLALGLPRHGRVAHGAP